MSPDFQKICRLIFAGALKNILSVKNKRRFYRCNQFFIKNLHQTIGNLKIICKFAVSYGRILIKGLAGSESVTGKD